MPGFIVPEAVVSPCVQSDLAVMPDIAAVLDLYLGQTDPGIRRAAWTEVTMRTAFCEAAIRQNLQKTPLQHVANRA